MRLLVISLLSLLSLCAALHVVAPVGVTRRVGIPRMCKTGPDPNLDLPDERDDLAAAFAKRIEEEGGATQFKIKSELKNVASGLQGGVQKVKDAGNEVADTVSDATRQLPPNFIPFLGVVAVLSFLPTLFAMIAAM